MSLGFGHENEEVLQLQRKLAAKDAQYATLDGELLKRTKSLRDLKTALDDALHKLRAEADRVLRLEDDLARRSDDLKQERLNLMNAETTMRGYEEKMKAQDLFARDLQATIDSMSYIADGSDAKYAKLIKENSVLELKVKELQKEIVLAQRPPVFQAPPPTHARSRPRSSSVSNSNARVDTLEQEVNSLRAAASELQTVKDKLSQGKEQLIKQQNENIALERRFQGKIWELESALEDRDEDMEILRVQCQEGHARMEELQKESAAGEDVEEIKRALKKAQKALEQERLRVLDAEYRQEQASREVAEAKREAAMLADRLSTSQSAREPETRAELRHMPIDSAPSCQECSHPSVEKIAHLLAAIDRLRNERDGLRRSLDFVELEAKFAAEASATDLKAREEDNLRQATELRRLQSDLEKAEAGSGVEDVRIAQLEDGLKSLRGELDETSLELRHARVDRELLSTMTSDLSIAKGNLDRLRGEAKRLRLAAVALAVTASHSASQCDASTMALREELHQLEQESRDIVFRLSSAEDALHASDQRLATTEACLEESESERAEMQRRLDKLEGEIAMQADDTIRLTTTFDCTKFELERANDRVAELEKTLENTQADRANLALQLEHLQEELTAAQREVSEVEAKSRAQAMALSNGGKEQVLGEQIQALLEKVDRRTEQIGLHQHDIRRLETNLQLQEERVAELITEADMAAGERQAMLEDCANARDARDEADARVDGLELEVEQLKSRIEELTLAADRLHAELADTRDNGLALEASRELELVTTVQVLFQTISRSRNQIVSMTSAGKGLGARITHLIDVLAKTEEAKAALITELSQRDEEWTAMVNKQKITDEAVESLTSINAQLESAAATIAGVQRVKDDLESALRSVTCQLTEKTKSLEERDIEHQHRLKDVEDRHSQLELTRQAIESELMDAKLNLQEQIEQAREDKATAVADFEKTVTALRVVHDAELETLHSRLQEVASSRGHDNDEHKRQLSQATGEYEHARQALTEAKETLASVRLELQSSQVTVNSLEEEKILLQQTMTNLEAELQKSASFRRHLESQIKDEEHSARSLRQELQNLREEHAQFERSGKAAEIELRLQAARLELDIRSLQRKLAAYSGPTLEETVADLQERNDEKERLLQAKCAEIEDSDDRIIKMLKEKKKLTSKVDSLSRKVQSLQNKLAEAAGPTSTTAPVPSNPLSAAQPSEGLAVPPQRPASVPATTVFATATPSTLPPRREEPHQIPALAPQRPFSAPSASEHRNTSRPTIEPRRAFTSKAFSTPDSSSPTAPMVSHAQTAESRVDPFSTEDLPVSAGKKRAAPDDFDPIEPLPAQPILAESITPRQRKPSHTNRAGFTPVRSGSNAARPALAKPSPLRRMASTLVPSLSDAPGSPKSHLLATKQSRGWLGKIRGGGPPLPRPVFESIQNAERIG